MRSFSSSELGSMARTQEGAMMDQCLIYAHSNGALNAYGKKTDVYAAGVASICGFDATGSGEILQGTEVLTIDAAIRLPVATVIDDRDRIQLTKRFGKSVTPIMFDVVGLPEMGPSGIVAKVRRVNYA